MLESDNYNKKLINFNFKNKNKIIFLNYRIKLIN
jgi:hypothetical protein